MRPAILTLLLALGGCAHTRSAEEQSQAAAKEYPSGYGDNCAIYCRTMARKAGKCSHREGTKERIDQMQGECQKAIAGTGANERGCLASLMSLALEDCAEFQVPKEWRQ
jgi:hypothetical protein